MDHAAHGRIRLIHPRRAAVVRFDAYIASDFMWAPLLRDTARIQIFHGVGGKYGFDAPDRSMREWHRLFFVNERRLRNFIACGAIDADSPAIRLVGMPKVDCLVDGTYQRDHVLQALGLDPSRPTVLYAPTWSPASSLNAMGVELIEALGRMPVNVIMKLHDRSRDLRERYSGGVDWAARLQPLLVPGKGALAPGHDISPYLVAADVMVTDHSSAGFEYLLRDRPLVRIHRPQLIELANVHPDYVALLASVSQSVDDLPATLARGRAGAEPSRGAERRAPPRRRRPVLPAGRCDRTIRARAVRRHRADARPCGHGRAGPARGRGAMATVSVVMPAYNVAAYIGAAIDSVKAQTVADWELLIVDDGSTDATCETVRRVRRGRSPDPAAGRSRTAGSRQRATWPSPRAAATSSPFSTATTSGSPTYLAEQLAVFAQHPEVDIVTGNGWFLGSQLNGQPARPFPDGRPQPTLQTILADETSIFIMSLFRRRVYEAIGGFDESLRTNEDYDYWLRAALAGFRFRRNDRPLCHYRRRDDSVSAIDVNMLAGILRVYRKLRPLLKDRPAELRTLDAQTGAVRARVSRRPRAHRAEHRGRGERRQPPVGALRTGRRAGRRRGQLHGPAHAEAPGARLPVAPRLSRSDVMAAPGSLGRTLARRVALGVRRVDHAVGRLAGRRRILVEARTPMNLAVIRPVLDRLRPDPRVRLQFTGPDRADLRDAFRELGVDGCVIGREEATWTRFDLYINADPWEAVSLRRVSRQLNFFHGVAGKYNLDCPADLPLGFERYDAVAFPNAGRRDATSPPASCRRIAPGWSATRRSTPW